LQVTSGFHGWRELSLDLLGQVSIHFLFPSVCLAATNEAASLTYLSPVSFRTVCLFIPPHGLEAAAFCGKGDILFVAWNANEVEGMPCSLPRFLV
jgi:hypothetical protein